MDKSQTTDVKYYRKCYLKPGDGYNFSQSQHADDFGISVSKRSVP